MKLILRLNEDRLSAGDPVYLPAAERIVYILEGELTIEFSDGCISQVAGSAWLGGRAIGLIAEAGGARLLRWELAAASAVDDGVIRAAPAAVSDLRLSSEMELDPGFGWLMRCDRVSFPKGGIAYNHVHQGPGIRYCLEGEIEIQSEGASTLYGPGEPWFEVGSAPVLAPTSKLAETSFVRGFVLPRACKGRSSIRYVDAEDAAKPKLQRYKVLGERFIDLPRA